MTELYYFWSSVIESSFQRIRVNSWLSFFSCCLIKASLSPDLRPCA
jgi:hypothetical protein